MHSIKLDESKYFFFFNGSITQLSFFLIYLLAINKELVFRFSNKYNN